MFKSITVLLAVDWMDLSPFIREKKKWKRSFSSLSADR